MKIRINFPLDIDVDRWREEMMADPHASINDVRDDVQTYCRTEIMMGLGEHEVLKPFKRGR